MDSGLGKPGRMVSIAANRSSREEAIGTRSIKGGVL